MSQNQHQSQVLARKWRPRDLSSLVGQVHVVQALRHALKTQRLHHAYLFTGTRGVGKTTLARILAKAVNCETGVTDQPCGQCAACKQIDQGRFVDLLEVDAATNTGVDEMRDLLENAMYVPTSGRYKVYVIDEVHMLSKPAFNAMLKTLEEPPAHLLFILATTDPQKIPITVLSRCLQFNLRQMLPEQVVEHLQYVLIQEHIEFDVSALQLIGRAAQGSMRDALSLTDQAIAYSAGKLNYDTVAAMLGTVDQRYLYEMVQALADHNGKRLLALVDELNARSVSFVAALQGLAELLYRLSIAHVVPEAISFDDPERDVLHALLSAFTATELQLLYQIAIHGVRELPLAPEEALGFGMTLLRMLAFLPKSVAGGSSGLVPEKSMPPRPAAQVTSTRILSSNAISSLPEPAKIERPAIQALGGMLSGLGKRAAAISGAATSAVPVEVVNQPVSQNNTVAPTVGHPEPAVVLWPDSSSWPGHVLAMPASGLVKQALQCTEWGSVETRSPLSYLVHLRTSIKAYVTADYEQRLASTLSNYYGVKVQVRIILGEVSHTAQLLTQVQQDQKQCSAVESIEQDPFVLSLQQQLGAIVVPGSIQPLS